MAEGAHDNHPVRQTHRFVVFAFNARNGSRLWEREVARNFPHEGGHYTGSLASNSSLTDGKRIFAYFGSRGLFALNMKGEIVWERTFGRMATRHAHGEGSSPALKNGILVVNWDHEEQSRVIALNAETGDQIWEADRDEMTSWSTPLIVPHKDRFQVIISATKRVRSYDLESGKLIWECAGLARNVVATPVFINGLVIVGNSYDKQAMMGIQLQGARGDITNTKQVLWTMNRMTPYVPSPLIYDGALYFLRHNQAVLSCVDPFTGKALRGPYRLGGLREIFASPVAADGRVYVTGRNGATLVLSHETELRVLAINELDDQFSASPALVGEALYLRGEKYLYRIGTP
jgi:outer membrane protein assembly factor BamB